MSKVTREDLEEIAERAAANGQPLIAGTMMALCGAIGDPVQENVLARLVLTAAQIGWDSATERINEIIARQQ